LRRPKKAPHLRALCSTDMTSFNLDAMRAPIKSGQAQRA
jgi:hypothetical protein